MLSTQLISVQQLRELLEVPPPPKKKRVGKIRSELNKGKKGSKTHVVASSQ